MGRRLSLKEMSNARHEMDVHNALKKRGELDKQNQIVKELHVVCGCGAPGCIFICSVRDENKEKLGE